MKKLISIILLLSLSLSSGASALAYSSSQSQLVLYSQECPEAAIEFARENYLSFLTASVESGALHTGAIVSLGSPFTIAAQEATSDIYYFPIISDGNIVATFRIYKDSTTNSYVGIMSQYLADELTALNVNTSVPAILFMDEGNVMVSVDGQVDILLCDTEASTPLGLKPSLVGLEPVSLFSSLATIKREEMVSLYTISKYLYLDLAEDQGGESWCAAYAASSIIRYLTDYEPMARDIMELFYANPTDDNYLTATQVVSAGVEYGLQPYYRSEPITNPYAEIDAGRPIYLRCERESDSLIKSYHALVMRGYNISSDVYSIWNPWYRYYESMSASTKQYVVGDKTYTWVGTVYHWVSGE